jgi:antitoxin ParD1/3/4
LCIFAKLKLKLYPTDRQAAGRYNPTLTDEIPKKLYKITKNWYFCIKFKSMKNTSISLGNYFDQFVQTQVSAGRYKNVSEVIRAGLRLLENEESKIIALRNAIQQGIDSGIAHDFDPEKHLQQLKAKRKDNGKL